MNKKGEGEKKNVMRLSSLYGELNFIEISLTKKAKRRRVGDSGDKFSISGARSAASVRDAESKVPSVDFVFPTGIVLVRNGVAPIHDSK